MKSSLLVWEAGLCNMYCRALNFKPFYFKNYCFLRPWPPRTSWLCEHFRGWSILLAMPWCPPRPGQHQYAKIELIRNCLPWETWFMKSSLLGLCNTAVHGLTVPRDFAWIFAYWECHDLWRSSLEVSPFSKSKSLHKNCVKLPKIGRVFVQVLNEFLHILKTSMDDHVFKQFMDEFLLFWPLKTLWQLLWTSSEVVLSMEVFRMYKNAADFW